MLKDSSTKLRIDSMLIFSIIMVVIFIFVIVVNAMSKVGAFAMEKDINIEIKEKVLEPDFEDVLVAYSDNINYEVAPASPREKISSRAATARRNRGESNNYIPVNEVKISQTMDLNVRTGMSKEDFINLIANCSADTSGFFEENAGIIYDLCEIYSINEIFFCGLISAESGWNIAQNHRNTHNYISLMSGGGLISFSTVEEGLESSAKTLHNNYLTPGGKFYRGSTLEGVRTIFCPVNPGWTSLVYGRMCQII